MGLDYKNLKPYGGFSGMVQHIMSAETYADLSNPEKDMAAILKSHLVDGQKPEANGLLASRSPGDHVLSEVKEGLDGLVGSERDMLKAKLLKIIL